ncbi:MAG: TPM domain-containing protein [Pseudomonadota bacterium]
MIRRWLLVLALLAFAPAALGQTFPKLAGRVVDDAALLSPAQEQALTAKLAGLEQQSGRQLVVATIPDLQGYDIADYGYRLGRAWGIGDKAKNDGALLIVAPAERKIRIEVGYGMEGVLTDALSSQIIRTAITPRFKAGDMPGGIDAGADEIGKLMLLSPDEAKARAAAAEAAQRQDSGNGGGGGMLFIWAIILIVIFVAMAAGRRGGGGGKGQRYRSGSGGPPIILWGPGDFGGGGGSGWGGGGGGGWGGGGGFSGGGGSFGGGGASGDW